MASESGVRRANRGKRRPLTAAQREQQLRLVRWGEQLRDRLIARLVQSGQFTVTESERSGDAGDDPLAVADVAPPDAW